MAEGKKSFMLYADQKELFSQLSDEQAGMLIKHIFAYVNDENPETKDLIINLAFTPIKQQLKRDLKTWENIKTIRSEAGKAGAKARWQKIAKDSKRILPIANDNKNAVNVNVNVNDNVIKEKKEKKEKKGVLVFPWNDERFLDQWENWIEYKKKEFNFKYKSDQSQQAALKKLSELANGDMENALTIMHMSMANGWKGFFSLQENKKSKEDIIKSNLKGW